MFFLRIIALVFIITLAFRRLKCSHFYGLMLSADQDEDPNTGIVTITLHWRLAFNPSSTAPEVEHRQHVRPLSFRCHIIGNPMTQQRTAHRSLRI